LGLTETHLQRAWVVHGEAAFEYVVLEFVERLEHLLEREQYWIDAYPGRVLYNSSPTAGSNLGFKMPEAVVARRRGTKLSESHRVAFGFARKGVHNTPEHNAKISAGKMGHSVSEETRAKIAEVNTGRPVPKETRDKIRASLAGRPTHDISTQARGFHGRFQRV